MMDLLLGVSMSHNLPVRRENVRRVPQKRICEKLPDISHGHRACRDHVPGRKSDLYKVHGEKGIKEW